MARKLITESQIRQIVQSEMRNYLIQQLTESVMGKLKKSMNEAKLGDLVGKGAEDKMRDASKNRLSFLDGRKKSADTKGLIGNLAKELLANGAAKLQEVGQGLPPKQKLEAMKDYVVSEVKKLIGHGSSDKQVARFIGSGEYRDGRHGVLSAPNETSLLMFLNSMMAGADGNADKYSRYYNSGY